MVFLLVSFLFAFFSALFLGELFIKNAHYFRAKTRDWTPQRHKIKDNTPTMGGLFLIVSAIVSMLMFVSLSRYLFIFLLATISFALIGLLDDWCKIQKQKGISARTKFLLQWVTAFTIATLLVWWAGADTVVRIPFINYCVDLGLAYLLWAAFLIVACSNAVNLTDGLDGLAASVLIPNFLFFSLLTYLSGVFLYDDISIIGLIFAGSTAGFLWYNRYPARLFMGDIGSLPLGAVYALIALVGKIEFFIPIVGAVFLFEELSVLLQVFSYKYFKRRIFKMAPVHHHFELVGWSEVTITSACASLTVALCLFCLAFILFF